ncbi:MAG TPA: VCBS repeat-containing protein, partial [Candidatus Saccharimonadales bacterium]|nr:VCBS repeat-containing protein [Candidatus Saccharimonadales bacterium]
MKKPARAARAACFCLALPLWLGLLHFLTPPRCQAAGLDWRPENGGRSAPLPVPSSGQAGFTLLPGPTTGLLFTNWLAQDRHLTNQILLNGSGVAAGDVDGDGRCDLYFCGLDGPNALFRNLGDWKFEDITAAAGVACPGMDASGAALADLDGDGDLDLIVNTVGSGTRIFLNDGHAHFQELTPPLNPQRCGTSLALADIDGDGDLDIYVANYRTVTIRDQPNTRFSFRNVDGQQQVVSVDGRPITDPDLIDRFVFRFSSDDAAGRGRFAYEENGEPDLLLRNEGGGRFTPVPFTGGAFLDEDGRPLSKPPLDWGLSVMFRDLNGDGAPDLYVCNDFKSPDRIWINDGHGRFRALAPLAIRQTCLSSMGVDVADVNRDGIDDLLVVDMLSRDHV